MDTVTLQGIHSHIERQQQGISHLLEVVREDLKHLDIIKQGLTDKQAVVA